MLADAAASRRLPWAIVAFLAASGVCSVCHGHHGEPPPKPRPPQSVVPAKVRWVLPPRWSWLHWWEANRDLYLRTLQQNRSGQKPDQKALAALRAQAAAALLAATKSPHWQARASAALALGCMREAGAFEALTGLAAEDPNETVREIALMALGLLDSGRAERFLLGRDYPTVEQREAALVAVGLLSKPSPAAVAGLQKVLAGSAVGPATMSAWALRHQTDPASAASLQEVLGRTESP